MPFRYQQKGKENQSKKFGIDLVGVEVNTDEGVSFCLPNICIYLPE
jgi:hypothetical protein